MRKRCSQLTIRLRFDCDTIRQRYDHRATSMRFPFDVHSLAFTYLSLSSGRGKLYTILYYTILYTTLCLKKGTTKYGLQCSSTSTRQRFEMLTNCDSVCWTFGAALNKTSHRRIHWPVACATQSMRAFGRRHFEHMLYIYLHRLTNKQITFLVDIY